MLHTAFSVLILLSTATGTAFAQNDPAALMKLLTGRWRMNLSKSQGMSALPGLRFRTTAGGELEELRGPEANPVVQPVRFGTPPYAVPESKNLISWKQLGSNRFERQYFYEGQLLGTRRIEISADGQSLTETSETKRPEGTSVATLKFRRKSGGPQGLAGVWQPVAYESPTPLETRFEQAGPQALRHIAANGGTQLLTLDGKPNPLSGAGVIPGITASAQQIDSRTMEVTSRRNGVLYMKQRIAVSQDGKTLTLTATRFDTAGNAEGNQSLLVYEKQ
jgi:hypothetical protein